MDPDSRSRWLVTPYRPDLPADSLRTCEDMNRTAAHSLTRVGASGGRVRRLETRRAGNGEQRDEHADGGRSASPRNRDRKAWAAEQPVATDGNRPIAGFHERQLPGASARAVC